MAMIPGVDTLIESATNKAFTFGANKLDTWTKDRDAKRADSACSVGKQTQLPLGAINNGNGGSSYASVKYSRLAQLPMFPLYSANDDHALSKGRQAAAQMRGSIQELETQINPLQRMVLSLSGGGLAISAKKAENAMIRVNAQSQEDRVAQKHLCLLSRWTLSTMKDAQESAATLLVDILEFRVKGPMNMNGVTVLIRANADAKLSCFGNFTADVKRSKVVTKGVRGLEVDERVSVVLDDGSEVAMEVVAYETRLISMAEMQGGLRAKHRGTQKRFGREWMVPVV